MNALEKGKALSALLHSVRQLHQDCTQLLADLDHWMESVGYRRLGDNTVASGFSYSRKNANYLANVLFSRWANEKDPCLIRTVNIILFEKDQDWYEVPYIVAAELLFSEKPELKSLEMDGWTAWSETLGDIDKDYVLTDRNLGGRLKGGAVSSTGLAEVESLGVLTSIFDRLRVSAVLGEGQL